MYWYHFSLVALVVIIGTLSLLLYRIRAQAKPKRINAPKFQPATDTQIIESTPAVIVGSTRVVDDKYHRLLAAQEFAQRNIKRRSELQGPLEPWYGKTIQSLVKADLQDVETDAMILTLIGTRENLQKAVELLEARLRTEQRHSETTTVNEIIRDWGGNTFTSETYEETIQGENQTYIKIKNAIRILRQEQDSLNQVLSIQKKPRVLKLNKK